MRSLLALLLLGWTFAFADRILRRVMPDPRDGVARAVAAGGFGLGFVTLVSLWVMLASPGSPAFAIALGASVSLWLADRVVDRAEVPVATELRRRAGPTPIIVALAAATAICGAAIVFDAAYWPFENGDALALYAPFGKFIYK